MFKPTLILITTVFISIASYGQPFKKKSCFTYPVNESKIEFTIPEAYNENHIFIDEVKQNPEIEEILVQTNYCNKLLPLEFTGDMAKSFKKIYNANVETGMRAIDIYIRDLNIRTNYLLEDKHQIMELGLDYFMRENGKSKKIFSTHHAAEMPDKGEVEKSLSDLMRLSTIDFLVFHASNKSVAYFDGSVAEPVENEISSLQKGIYTSFKDLKNNEPSVALNETVTTIGNNDRYFLKCPETGKPVKQSYMFGFSDGESVYLNTAKYYDGNHFIKLKPFEGNYSISEDIVHDEQKLTAYYSTSETPSDMAFGAISVMFDESLSTKKNKLLVNMDNGSMIVINNSNFKKMLKKDKELLRLYYNIENKNENCKLNFLKELAKRGKL